MNYPTWRHSPLDPLTTRLAASHPETAILPLFGWASETTHVLHHNKYQEREGFLTPSPTFVPMEDYHSETVSNETKILDFYDLPDLMLLPPAA